MATGGRIVLPAAEPVFSALGVPSAGASLTVYLTGTTTLVSLFADAGLTTAVANPQASNSAGLFYSQSTSLFADPSQAYDYVLSLPTGELYYYQQQSLVAPEAGAGNYLSNPSPQLLGTPTAPTPAANDASSKIATTQFVATVLSAYTTNAALAATLSSYSTTAQMNAAIAAAGAGTTQIVASARLTLSGTTLTVAANNGFSSITRSSAGAYNFVFATARPDTNYRISPGVENNTQLAAVVPPGNKTASGFAISVLTYNNIPNDPAGLDITVSE